MLKRKNKIYLKPFAAACMLILSACSSDETVPVNDNQGKTPIELTVGIVGENHSGTRAATRAIVTTDRPYAQDAEAFGSTTNLYMILKSDNGAGSGTKYSRSMGTVTTSSTTVGFSYDYLRYWEDSYSRASKLSVYSACVPGQSTALTIGGSSEYNSNTWSPSEIATTIEWPMFSGTVANQDDSFLAAQDLCFSNNVSNLGSDNRVSYDDGTKRFTTGNMIYYHALTWVTFKIKKGNGFTADDDFDFTYQTTQNPITHNYENIVLKDFNTSGTFTITDGEFTSTSTGDINQLALIDHRTEDNPAYEYVLDGFMVPGSLLEGTALNQVSFTIDDNTYHLTKNQLQAALNGKKLSDNSTSALEVVSEVEKRMRPGVHYVFEMTVGKKMMDKLTAKVVNWETVNADETTPTNARITVDLLENGVKKTGEVDFDLYRSEHVASAIPADENTYANYEWKTGYVGHKASLTGTETYVGWYWPNNKTFYHFRTVMPTDHTVSEDGTNVDYLSIAYAPVEATYDICWGAPFKNTTGKLTYDKGTYGFDGSASHQISKAIGPTTGTINMEMFHMMSDVTINLSTPVSGDADYSARVDLTNAKMELTNISKSGKVLMGNGLVIPSTTVENVSNESSTPGTYTTPWNYYFVPQDLTNVVLTITTSDNNQYIVDMKDVLATTIGSNLIANPYTALTSGTNSGKFPINHWYPNYKYTYTFKLTKTGIANMTATLADWETVTAGNDNVQIK